jgi:uncharacterized protein YuzE
MNIEIDSDVDAAYARLSDRPACRTVEESDVCIVDYDEQGQAVGIELLSVFGFAGASLRELAAKGVVTDQLVDEMLSQLRGELVAA